MTDDRQTRRTRPVFVTGVLAIAVGVLALLASAAPAGAQYVPGQPGIIVDPSEMSDAGGVAEIQGFGCPAATPVDAYIVVEGEEVPIGSSTSEDDPDGSFTIPITVPASPAGEYTVLVRCGPLTLSTLLTLTPSPVAGTAEVTATEGTLPRTGGDAVNLVRVAALLIAAGGITALVVRKRRTSLTR